MTHLHIHDYKSLEVLFYYLFYDLSLRVLYDGKHIFVRRVGRSYICLIEVFLYVL